MARCRPLVGPEALHSHPRPGPLGKLNPEQLRLMPDFLWHGAESYGFRGDLWTCERVVGVLYEEFGVSYSKSQVSRLLKQMGWTPQIPITRAIQRDERRSSGGGSSPGPCSETGPS